ncbi:MAG: replication factor C large subunit [Thaumarchaeota archaeon]|nr:replication factor C large subunit [Candidatus Terraquivivens yellowstonensis]MCL7392837.1 replication factor C large subunit [Candidatus Terraquivivens yellowstonensis]MCL7397736.1 replication factor C large subunit [Candidatus Terraquivivens yellowstonensis]MCL7399942.1 replication factor C large subunit [Candidatus Terraquivivens yellowstonensis]
MTVPWVEKYRPKRVSEVIGNKEAIEAFLNWMASWEKGRPSKKAAFLYGPAGVGKTSLVIAYATEKGYDLVEVNASDWRTAEKVKAIVGSACEFATLDGMRKRIVLVDEVDGIAGQEDAGGIPAIRDAIEKTKVPIVLIANDPWSPRLATIREMCEMIEFKHVPKNLIISHLRKICALEGLECSDDVLKAIAERSNGDVRSAINDLQALAMAGPKIDGSTLAALGYRDRVKEIFSALVQVFHAKSIKDAWASTENIDVDIDTFFNWVLDNAPQQLTDPEDLERAMDFLAKADLYFARIKRMQRWNLLRYAVPLMTGGIALSKKKTPKSFVKFSFPQKIRMLQATKHERDLRNGLASKIASKCHMSSYKANVEMLPFLSFIIKNDGNIANGLARFFELSESELSYLSGKPEEVKELKVEAAKPKRKSSTRQRSEESA